MLVLLPCLSFLLIFLSIFVGFVVFVGFGRPWQLPLELCRLTWRLAAGTRNQQKQHGHDYFYVYKLLQQHRDVNENMNSLRSVWNSTTLKRNSRFWGSSSFTNLTGWGEGGGSNIPPRRQIRYKLICV